MQRRRPSDSSTADQQAETVAIRGEEVDKDIEKEDRRGVDVEIKGREQIFACPLRPVVLVGIEQEKVQQIVEQNRALDR